MLTIGLYGIQDTDRGEALNQVHDHALAVMRDGRVEAVLQLERETRRKHDNRLGEFLPDLLSRHVAPGEPVRFASVNSFAGSAFASADGSLRIEPDETVHVRAEPHRGRVRWLPNGERPRDATGSIVSHEIAHVASILPFVGAFEPNSLLVHIDGGASDSASSFWSWDGHRAELLDCSWDRLKRAVNNFNSSPLARALLGLQPEDHLSMPGKLMGYAGHGEARPALVDWLLENEWFLEHDGNPGDLLARINRRFGTRLREFDPHEPLFSDMAATIQAWFEEQVVEAISSFAHRSQARHLYYAGGAALNIGANVRLERSGLFESVHVPPCPSDAGLALGAAAWVEYRETGRLTVHDAFLQSWGMPSKPAPLDSIPEVARVLAEGGIVGLCDGAGEVGPRALGHRSILARADSVSLRQRVSETIKRREWYRPIAPVVTEEVALKAFGAEVAASSLARIMLGGYRPKPGWGRAFEGVLHRDGTVRVQVVGRKDPEPRYLRHLLDTLRERHDVPALLNTSFNGPGEPIVHRHDEAVSAARRLGLDAVVVHGSLHRP